MSYCAEKPEIPLLETVSGSVLAFPSVYSGRCHIGKELNLGLLCAVWSFAFVFGVSRYPSDSIPVSRQVQRWAATLSLSPTGREADICHMMQSWHWG